MSARTTKSATEFAGIWTLALLSGVVAVAACSSSGSAARDASGADHQGGADASLDGSGADHQGGGDASLDDRPTDLANDRADDAVSSDASAETADVNDDGGSTDADVRSEDGPSDGGATTDGAGADATSDGAALPCPTCALYTTFMFEGEQTQAPGPGFIRYQAAGAIDLFNGSDQTVSLAGVKIRYWFTSNESQWNVVCAANCGGVQTTNIVGIPPRNGADTYVEIVFAPGQLGAFSDVGPMSLSFDATDNNAFFDRPELEDDYSFLPNPTTPNAHITVYANNKLVWGMEP